MKVICDTSVLITLASLGKLDLLQKLWKVVLIPRTVLNEVLAGNNGKKEVLAAVEEGWIDVKEDAIEATPVGLDPGEFHCLALAEALKADLLVLDERKARQVACETGYSVTGTLGVLLSALAKGLLDSSEVPDLCERLRAINFYVTKDLLLLLYKASQTTGEV